MSEKKHFGVIGSRSFSNYELLASSLNNYVYKGDVIVSGGAKGADSLAERFAKENSIEFVVYPANWEKFGKSAGFKRNVDIVNSSDIIIAFWDGKSKGTMHSIELAKKMNKKTIIIKV